MLKQYSTVFKNLMIFADLCIAAFAFYLGYVIQAKYDTYVFARYEWIMPVFAVIWVAMLYFFEMYESFRLKPPAEIIAIVIKASFFTLIFFISFVFMFNLYYVNRDIMIFSITLSALMISVEKAAVIAAVRMTRKMGYNYRNLLIVGTGERAMKFISLVEGHNEWGYRVLGLVDKDPARNGRVINGYKVLGSFADVPAIINDNVVDEVIFVVPRSWIEDIEEVMRFCETEGIKTHVTLDYFNLRFSRTRQTDFHGVPLLTFESGPAKVWSLFAKRVFDVVVSAALLVALSPLFILIAAVVKGTSKGPVFFRQERCGLNGRKFTFYKFRTMFDGAENRIEELRKFNEMGGPVFKMKKDPRITPAGAYLRKFSLDELPQLWNVLKGDMSIIGPRPPIPTEVKKYDYWQRRRLSMKPGLSCLWQIRGRNMITDFEDWMKLDLEYIDNWSLWLDTLIFFKTIPVVMFGIGAK